MKLRKANLLLVIAAVVLTPWLVFVSSSIELYLLNQESLGFKTSVLFPFFVAFLLGVLFGFGILLDSQKNQHYLTAPWLYLTAGPLFLIANTAGLFSQHASVSSAILITLLISWFVLSRWFRKFPITKFMPFFAVFACLVVGADVVKLVTGVHLVTHGANVLVKDRIVHQKESSLLGDQPNIYHVLFDGYQSDVFEYLLDEELRSELAGVTYFQNNISPYANTRISIPAVFLGKKLDTNLSLEELQFQAFNSPHSLLGVVTSRGYYSQAYLHQEFDFSPNRFDLVRFHYEFKKQHAWSGRAFEKLWLYSYWPRLVSKYFLGLRSVDLIEAGQLSPEGFPVSSLDAFLAFLEQEKHEPTRNRYVFLHLILPHPPYLLTDDCAVDDEVEPQAQYQCANLLVVKLIRELKRLGRYDDSMLIFHSDHGDNLKIVGNNLREIAFEGDTEYRLKPEFNFRRAKSLLLFKPFGKSLSTELQVSHRESTLLDIAPTVSGALGLGDDKHFIGTSLVTDLDEALPRFFYVDAGIKLHRYLYTEDGLLFDGMENVKMPTKKPNQP